MTIVAVVRCESDERQWRSKRRNAVEKCVGILSRKNERRFVERVKVAGKAATTDAVATNVGNWDPDFVVAGNEQSNKLFIQRQCHLIGNKKRDNIFFTETIATLLL